jgi:radical SAM-linked protein
VSEFRLRINFQKLGACRYLSHLDLARAMERCVRRAALPYAVSQGFSAHMKHSFSAALPVGTGSLDEYMDVELARYVPRTAVLLALREAAAPGLPVLDAVYVDHKQPALAVSHIQASYEVLLYDPAGVQTTALMQRLERAVDVEVVKKGKPKSYKLDEYVYRNRTRLLKTDSAGLTHLALVLRLTPNGSLRPEVLLKALALPDLDMEIREVTRVSLTIDDSNDVSNNTSTSVAGSKGHRNIDGSGGRSNAARRKGRDNCCRSNDSKKDSI